MGGKATRIAQRSGSDSRLNHSWHRRQMRPRKEKRMSKAYHEDNLVHQPFPREAVVELAQRAAELGVQFKINGIPYGAEYNKELWDRFHATVEPPTSGV